MENVKKKIGKCERKKWKMYVKNNCFVLKKFVKKMFFVL